MNRKVIKKVLGFVVVGLFALTLIPSLTIAAETVYNLTAQESTITLPGGNKVTIWAFAEVNNNNRPKRIRQSHLIGRGKFKIPGPVLTVPPGDTLRINLTNNLNVPVSIIIPGQAMPVSATNPAPQVVRNGGGRITSFTHETAPGTTEAYIWPNFKPGTYLYHSGTHPAVQVQMGLYGAIKQDAVLGQAYAGHPYDNEVVLLYSEIDPTLHAAVAGGTYGTSGPTSTVDYKPTYFLINGKLFDPSNPNIAGLVNVGDNVLLRFLNAGLNSHVPTFVNLNVNLIAEDGNPYPYPKEQYSLHLAAGKAIDALVTVPAAVSGTRYPIFDRMLSLTDATNTTGGMLTNLRVN